MMRTAGAHGAWECVLGRETCALVSVRMCAYLTLVYEVSCYLSNSRIKQLKLTFYNFPYLICAFCSIPQFNGSIRGGGSRFQFKIKTSPRVKDSIHNVQSIPFRAEEIIEREATLQKSCPWDQAKYAIEIGADGHFQ